MLQNCHESLKYFFAQIQNIYWKLIKVDYLWKCSSWITECSSDNIDRNFRQKLIFFLNDQEKKTSYKLFWKVSSKSSSGWVGSTFGTALKLFDRGPKFLCSKCELSYKNFFSRQLVFRKTFSGEIVCSFDFPSKKLFFAERSSLIVKLGFFSNEFVFSKMSVWTCTRHFWHHCDKLFARFSNLIVTLCLLHLNSSSTKFSSAYVKCIREIVCILTSHPKHLFFRNFQLHCIIYVFFGRILFH